MNSPQGSSEASQTADERLEEFAFLHGQCYDSYLSTEGNLEQFWSSDGRGLIPFARIGKYVHVQGGLLAAVDDRPLLLREFFEFLNRQRYHATFYNIGEGDLPLFRDQGFQVTKWGEEPLLDLAELTWSGHDYEWVRRQVNYCRRQNVVLSECIKSDYSTEEWDELTQTIREIAGECTSTKPQHGDVGFFNASVDPSCWHRRRLFIARSENDLGRIEGFLICLPYDNGQQWSIELYRHRLDAPRGLVPFMIHEAADRMKAEGVQTISLCLCPAIRCNRIPNDSWIIRRCLQFGFNFASVLFDMPGAYHFKSRFRPRFVQRYICHWPRATVGSMWSIVRMSKVLDLDLKKLANNLWTRWTVPKKRQNLASPNAPKPKKHADQPTTVGK